MTRKKEAERREAVETLRKLIKPGDTIYTVLKHVSRSGMMREISVHHVDSDGRIGWLSGLVATALDMRRGDRDGVKITGCGMDMGFAIVYDLSRVMFRDGFECIGERCPSNDHSNRAHNTFHQDGGYALRHSWL